MEISIKKTQAGIFSLSINGTLHTLDTHDLKTLVMETVRVLSPGVLPTPSNRKDIQNLTQNILSAEDSHVQDFILHADDHSLLLLLECSKDTPELHEKLFANMSHRKRKMLAEDLQFCFPNGASDEQVRAMIRNLSRLADRLHPIF